MKKTWVFGGSGIGISTWEGNAGDTKSDVMPEACGRLDAPFVLCVVKGAMFRSEAVDGVHVLAKPGFTTEQLPDIVPGRVTWEVREDGTLLVCPGPIDADNYPLWTPINKVIHDGAKTIKIDVDHVAVLISGSCNGEQAPHIFHAGTSPLDLYLGEASILVEVWRKA